MPVLVQLTLDNIVSARTQGSYPVMTWRLFRHCETEFARYAHNTYRTSGINSQRGPEAGQARYQARQSGQNLCSYETKAVSVYTNIYNCIYVIYVVGCIIPTFVGLVVYTLIYRDSLVINLNGKDPEISVTGLRNIWN